MFEALVFIIAGALTGLITGIVGASAVVAFIPIIFIFFDYSTFALIGMSLVLDIFISIPALFNYLKYKHVNLKAGFCVIIPAVIGVIIGSSLSTRVPDSNLFGFTVLFASFAGITIFRRKTTHKESGSFSFDLSLNDLKFWILMVLSVIIGLLGGLVGAAGGLSVLFLFIFIYGFETHEAIGTSIFIMFFIALFGAITHFYYLDKMQFSWVLLLLSVIGGILGSLLSSKIANKISERTLNRVVGTLLFVLGIAIFLYKIVFKNFFN